MSSAGNSSSLAPSSTVVDGGTPRLMIEKMIVENFKSYAGKKTIGPFHKCFSAVVGPNGSGKSNVIDALLFVFAKRAKQMRQSKLSDLIHRSDVYPNLDRCGVTVFFQEIYDDVSDPDAFQVVPNSEFSVSREIVRDGKQDKSTYRLNGHVRTMGEVTELLKSKGIDLDFNRFLILQGEVEQIAMMKPKGQSEHEDGLLEYIEDIIGSNRLKEPIDNAEIELEALNESRIERMNRLHAVERERDGLENAKIEAEQFVRTQLGLLQKKHKLAQIFRNEAEKFVHDEEEKIATLQQKADEKKQSIDSVSCQVEEQKRLHSSAKTEHEKLTKKLSKAKEEYSSFERESIRIREDAKHVGQQRKKIETKLSKDQLKLSELQRQVSVSQEEILEKEKAAASLRPKFEEEKQAVEEIMNSLRGQTDDLRIALEEQLVELRPLNEVIVSRKQEVDISRQQLNLLLQSSSKAQEECGRLERLIEENRAIVDEKLRVRSECDSNLNSLQSELSSSERELELVQAEEMECTRKLRDLRAQLEDVEIAAQQNERGNRVQTAISEAIAQGKLPGVLGRLGNLGYVDKKYDIAASTASSALDNIVCEDTSSAQRVMEFLKRHNIGRVTCIILEEMERLRKKMKSSKNSTPLPRLFDLVNSLDDKFSTAFYFAFGETLVAENLDEATAVAYVGNKVAYRVVTQDGKLIDSTGTMSGGGSRVQRGLISTSLASAQMASSSSSSSRAASSKKSSPEIDVKAVTAEMQNLENRIDSCHEGIRRLRESIASLRSEIRRVETQASKATMELEAKKEIISELEGQLQEAMNDAVVSSKDKKAITAAEGSLSAATAAYEAAVENASGIQSKVNQLQCEIEDIGGPRLKSQQYKVDRLREQIEEYESAVAKAQGQIESSQKIFSRSQNAVEKLQAELEELDARAKELESENEEIEMNGQSVRGKYEELLRLQEEKQEELEVVHKEFSSLTASLRSLRDEEMELVNTIEELQDSLRSNKSKQQVWTKKLEEYSSMRSNLLPYILPSSQASTNSLPESVSAPEESSVENFPLPFLPESDLSQIHRDRLEYDITLLEERVHSMEKSGDVNLSTLEEYRKKCDACQNRHAEFLEVSQQRDMKQQEYERLRRERLDMFMRGFSSITMKLKEMYQMITLGGDAELELVDSLDPFSEGIVFSVRPPKKSWKNISNLSGGEKTLSSLALVFALHHFKPTPLYVMDEIDAALDFKNVSIVANYIKERTKDAQFIIISLRNNMFELADRLVGIYKTNNMTNSLTIDPRSFRIPIMTVSEKSNGQATGTAMSSYDIVST